MKPLFILLVAFLTLMSAYSGISRASHQSVMDARHPSDSLAQAAFQEYLDLVLSSPSDTSFQVDTSLRYRINFITSHGFNFISDFQDSLYEDSLQIICLSNPIQIKDSIIRLNFIKLDAPNISYTKLRRSRSEILKVLSFVKLDPISKEPYYGLASFRLDAEHSRLMSFNSGQYLIVGETYFEPDVRSSMPPGVVKTYFLELVQ